MINFYKKSNGAFVLDNEEYGNSTAGQFYSETKGNYLALYNVFTGEKRFDSPYTEYRKENGLAYSSLQELLDATYEFFTQPVTATTTGSSSELLEFVLSGVDGNFTNGERTGSVKVFTLPNRADINKAMIVFDGLNFTKEYTVSLSGSNKLITFTDAPLENSYVLYQSTGNVVVVNDEFSTIYTNPATGLKFRTIIRDGQLYFDKELTTTGFSGTESTDGGVTGDWMTIGGF